MRQVRRRASGWLPIQPSRYSTVLSHLFSRNLPKNISNQALLFVPLNDAFLFIINEGVLTPPASSCCLAMRTSDAFRHATHADSKEIPFSLARFRSGLTNRLRKTESNRWERPKHPDDRRVLNQCKSQAVGNAAQGCRMTNKRKPSARPKKMRANGPPQSRIPRNKHSCKTQNPGVHTCSLRP
jgi:hypothetical protein